MYTGSVCKYLSEIFLSSTSANKTKKSFEYDFAFEKCDVEVISNVGFFETSSSKIYKLGKKRLKKIR